MAAVYSNRAAFLRQGRIPKPQSHGPAVDPQLFADVLAQIRRILLEDERTRGPRPGW